MPSAPTTCQYCLEIAVSHQSPIARSSRSNPPHATLVLFELPELLNLVRNEVLFVPVHVHDPRPHQDLLSKNFLEFSETGRVTRIDKSSPPPQSVHWSEARH